MEFPHVGANCSYAGCADLDFLPVTCDYCTKQFCSTHGNPIAHHCDQMPERTVEATSSTKDKDYIPITKYTKPARIGPKDVRAPTKNELTDRQRQALAALKQTHQSRAPLRAAPLPKKQPAKATGNPNMAMEDRLYLSVASEAKTIVVFINKKATIGSATDQFARQLGLSMLPGKVACRQ
ncbi:hypothetical protein DL89DRAFT_289295 [Linderina pennispora]|uniref:AN1-type domain-containing protein n=1 Tax=Linderina pennispora TaxID=61395 RepID=A0A1Y1VPY4_9FUNG|nr:uncharacterized protein DL89DRAFT_289295 [Linderina pennispora]ORX63337.1 hypothetical protein DL89DRAFT_289295 [Linderina pennispora]